MNVGHIQSAVQTWDMPVYGRFFLNFCCVSLQITGRWSARSSWPPKRASLCTSASAWWCQNQSCPHWDIIPFCWRGWKRFKRYSPLPQHNIPTCYISTRTSTPWCFHFLHWKSSTCRFIFTLLNSSVGYAFKSKVKQFFLQIWKLQIIFFCSKKLKTTKK